MDQPTLDFIQAAVMAKCDALDGVTDGILGDPFSCNFNITSLKCSAGQSPRVNNQTQCLTAAQVSAAQAFYQGPKDSRNGKVIYPGFVHGSESSWLAMETVLANIYSAAVLQNLVFSPSYNISNFNWGSDIDQVDLKAGTYIDHVSTDMHSFFNHGGKLLVTQGMWNVNVLGGERALTRGL
jgi:feruloyl esterase